MRFLKTCFYTTLMLVFLNGCFGPTSKDTKISILSQLPSIPADQISVSHTDFTQIQGGSNVQTALQSIDNIIDDQVTNQWRYWGPTNADNSWRLGSTNVGKFSIQIRVGGEWKDAGVFVAP